MKECEAQGIWQFSCRTDDNKCAYDHQLTTEFELRNPLTLQDLDTIADTTIRLTGCLNYKENIKRVLEVYDKILKA